MYYNNDQTSKSVPLLEPNRSQLAAFIDTVFRHATEGFVAVRSFADDGTSKTFRLSSSPVSERAFLLDLIEDDARRAAQDPERLSSARQSAPFKPRTMPARRILPKRL